MKNSTTPAVRSAATTTDGEKLSGRAGSARGRGGTIAGSGAVASPRSRRHWRSTSSGSSPR